MSLIINTPFECPAQHWIEGNGGNLEIKPERRPASYEVFDARNNTKRTEVLDLVNTIRARVDQWRADGWPGVTIITRKLLEHWHDRDARQYPFYFCQLEAIETLIWWVEGAEAYKQGIAIPGDGGTWERLCNKMATGAGKTTVMAMIITWQVLNALTYPKRNKDFSRAVFIVAPGLTVKERLQVLLPSEGSYYDEFNLCPSEALRQKLNQADAAEGSGPLGGEEGPRVRRGLHPTGAGQAGVAQGHHHHQRRGAPRLSQTARGEDQQEGGSRTGHRPR